MTRFEDNLWESVVDRHGDDLARADAPGASQPRRAQARRGVLAGGTLGLAAIGAGLVLAFSGSTAQPAFAITRASDGTVLVHLKTAEAMRPAEQQLAAMGLNEWFEPSLVAGKAHTGTVTCTIPTAAQAKMLSDATHRSSSGVKPGGPTVKVLLGSDGTEWFPAHQAGPTQPNGGPMHLMSCYLYSGAFPGPGNTGTGNTGGN